MTEALTVEWLGSGKPVVAGADDLGVSVAHDDWAAIAVAGTGEQGCDLAPVEPRPRKRWLGLLGAEREQLLDELIAGGDTLDVAGTRLWAAAEAAKKANADATLELARRSGAAALLRAGELHVLTFPHRLSEGPDRIVALVVGVEVEAEAEADGPAAESYGFDLSAYALTLADDGPIPGRLVVTVRFPLTFRESANLSRTLFFSHVFMWMGKLRELAVQPVYEPLARQFATGRWGMVTNYGETRYFGEARAEDTIEGRFWLGPASGRLGSTQEFHYEWSRVPPGSAPERFAWSRMGVTWVEILGHGVVEARELPEYYAALMDRVTPPDTPEVRAALEPSPAPDDIDLGPPLWSAPPGPAGGPVLHEEAFDTSLEESNLVGNIYFANYYVWQGVARDRFFQTVAPELYRGTGESGELRCLHHRTDHLREAMPFQRIAARMSLDAVHEQGVRLRFEMFRLEDGRRDKLGAAVHTAGWFAPVADGGPWQPAPLPQVLRDALLASTR